MQMKCIIKFYFIFHILSLTNKRSDNYITFVESTISIIMSIPRRLFFCYTLKYAGGDIICIGNVIINLGLGIAINNKIINGMHLDNYIYI